MLDRLTRLPLRWLTRGLQRMRRLAWYVRRPRTFGVHAIALTPAGRIILVRLRYADGWRLPGGGRGATEEPRAAVLRELREEIGLAMHGSVELVQESEEQTDYKRDAVSLFVVRDVTYRPRWSLEVEEICEATTDHLPDDISPLARRWLDAVRLLP